jgi:hypothetical protein
VRTAVADDTPDRALQAAKQEFEEAQTLFVKDQYDAAAQKFLAAYNQKPFAAFLFNAAVSFEKSQKLDKAAEHFEKYLQADPAATDAVAVKARVEAIRTILAPPSAQALPGAADGGAAAGPDGGAPVAAVPATPTIASLPVIGTKGLVVIDSKPPGATIYLDNKKAGPFAKTPWQGSLESKPVKLILEAKGFKPEERSIGPRSDKLVDVYIALSEEHFLGWVEIVSNVPGAEVFIDQREVGAIGRTPFTGHLKPGKHVIFVERVGYKPVRQDIDVLPGTATQHAIKLDKGDNGWISVAGRGAHGSKVAIDGKHACDSPCRTEVPPGTHRVQVKKEGFEDYDAELKVDRVTETVVEVQWSARPPRRNAWTTAIIGALFLGGGLYLGNLSNENRDSFRADKAMGLNVDNSDPRLSRGEWQAIGANVAFVLAGVLGIAATYGFLSHGEDSTGNVDQRTFGLGPAVSPGGGGVSAWGRF